VRLEKRVEVRARWSKRKEKKGAEIRLADSEIGWRKDGEVYFSHTVFVCLSF